MLTFQFKLFPNSSQHELLWSHANKLNWLYNYFLNQRIENFKNNIKISKSDQQKELVSLKETNPILNNIHSQVIQQVPLRLDRSYKNFFRRIKSKSTPGFPKFRSCRNFFGICYPQSGFKIQNNIFSTKVYGNIKFAKHRDIKGNIKQIYISNKNNKFFLNIITDATKSNSGIGEIGIDVGVKFLLTTNKGEKVKNRTDAKYYDKQIAFVQTKLTNLTKGSRRYKFLRKIIQRLYDAKVRKINDYQHKISYRFGSTYDTIYAEDLSIKTMSEGRYTNLNRSIRNTKLAQFIHFLSYKTNRLILVNPKNTSKTCNKCGKIHNIDLSIRNIECECGNKYDRDENAAKNVYCLGQAILGHPEYIGSMTIQEAITFR
jgi:putative transposase